MVSPFLMRHCAENNVLIAFLTENGRFLARVEGPTSGNVLLRREQYRRAESPAASAALAQPIVLAKAANSRAILQRALRDHGDKPDMDALQGAILRLDRLTHAIKSATDLDTLRGLEGDASHAYFSCFGRLITAQKTDFPFAGRNRRPPLDNVNALLSFVYTLLVHDCQAALEAVGLDPQVGFLHRDRPGRPSLALDLMEEFRAYFADRLVLSLINLRQVAPAGFRALESGAVEMTDETRKTVLVAYQKRKQEETTHPFLGESAPLGLFFHLQAQLLSRHLRGDLDGYPPVLWR
jgi:CRISPR-associated protein Cas1